MSGLEVQKNKANEKGNNPEKMVKLKRSDIEELARQKYQTN